MKCVKCIFTKEIDDETIKCCNLRSDEYGMKMFEKYDGCSKGKSSTVGLNETEKRSLFNVMY